MFIEAARNQSEQQYAPSYILHVCVLFSKCGYLGLNYTAWFLHIVFVVEQAKDIHNEPRF